MILSVRESSKAISELSEHVSILEDGIQKVSDMVHKKFLDGEISLKTWKTHPLNPKDNKLPFTVDWIFMIDTLNFSFWSDDESKKYEVTYKNETYTGYWSLCAAVNRALDEGIDIINPAFYSTVSLEALKQIFRSDNNIEIPLLRERCRILHETGKILLTKFEGSFTKCLSMCENSARKLLEIIVTNFPSYRDEAEFNGLKVAFYKRAQILIGDIWCCFEGKGCGTFCDIDYITIFADYRIPQALVYLGVLQYSEELENILKTGEHIKNGSLYEIEIRGCTIMAVEMICNYIKEKKQLPKDAIVNSILIDNFLWDYRRQHASEMQHVPFHKTRCIFY